MDNTYSSKYSGEQVDAAVEYFLNHSQTEESNSYEYTNTIFCRSNGFPASPFNESSLPTLMPLEFPFAGIDGKLWYDVPNTSTKDWYQCILKINFKSKKVVSQSKVLDMTGAKGDAGQNGSDGKDGSDGSNGADGSNGSNGNHTEFRYKRANAYAITLTDTQRESRFPEGWSADWSTADVESWSVIEKKTIEAFCSYLATFSSLSSISSPHNFFILGDNATYEEIAEEFQNNYQAYLVANSVQQAEIMKAFKEYRKLYIDTRGTIDDLTLNMEYHRLYKTYNDEDHLWLLFMISATISGEDDSLIGEWSVPQRMQGNDGKPGPSGSNGIDGIPGVNIGVAFTLGNEDGPRPDAKDPTTYPYNTNYNALFASGTFWKKSTPTVTKTYPYIWFTQCRYIVNTDSNGIQTYEFEDSWSTPARYTGLNGITTTETVYRRNPIIYPQGIYTAGVTYSNDGARTPYVYYDGNYYYLSSEGSWTGTESSTPANNSAWWTLLEGFEALYAKVGIIANGLIGSAVFNGKYMFSQQGVDQNGTASTHYERFLVAYDTGATLVNPYDEKASFKPNFCLNFETGELKVNSRGENINDMVASISSSVSGLNLDVSQIVDNKLAQAGINITIQDGVSKVIFTGDFIGSLTGEVSAKGFNVLDKDNSEVLKFTTYDSSMGTAVSGETPEEGTPIMIINYKGATYMVNMVKLTNSGAGITSTQVEAKIEDLYTASSIGNSTYGRQGYVSHHKITAAPYLKVLNSQGQATGQTIQAELYDSSGNQIQWSAYLNKYYAGTLIQEYPDKTDIPTGKWAFKVTGSLANVSETYNGTPEYQFIALKTDVTWFDHDSHISGSPTIKHADVYATSSVCMFRKIKLVNGVMSDIDNTRILVGYNLKYDNYGNVSMDAKSIKFIAVPSYNTSAYHGSPSGTYTTGRFATVTSNATSSSLEDISLSHSIVKPKYMDPN